MKRTALAGALFIATLIAAGGPAVADHIGLYSDQLSSSECAFVNPGVPVSTYVIHKFTPGATGSRWKVTNNSVMFNLGWTANGIYLGDPYTDFSVSYGECVAGEVVILSLQHMWFGQPMACGQMRIEPAQGFSSVLVVDCGTQEKVASGGDFYFNPTDVCQWYCYDPVETSTWGRVKSLYR